MVHNGRRKVFMVTYEPVRWSFWSAHSGYQPLSRYPSPLTRARIYLHRRAPGSSQSPSRDRLRPSQSKCRVLARAASCQPPRPRPLPLTSNPRQSSLVQKLCSRFTNFQSSTMRTVHSFILPAPTAKEPLYRIASHFRQVLLWFCCAILMSVLMIWTPASMASSRSKLMQPYLWKSLCNYLITRPKLTSFTI